MNVPDPDRFDQPAQRARFGPIRQQPPLAALEALSGAASGTAWTFERFGVAGGFPNGGIWRVNADSAIGTGPSSVWVKRTGPGHLGSSRVWRCRTDPDDPHWWGREAAFYESELASSGWGADARAARCHAVDDHDDVRDLWLEAVRMPASLRTCLAAVRGLARWQLAHRDVDYAWLSRDWIPTHVRRHGLDNQRTLAHPAWQLAIERGLDPAVRRFAETRVTDPARVRARLEDFPRVLTHFDFHDGNIGTVGDEVALIDWAYVGWGPIGHDAGHLALTLEADPEIDLRRAWRAIQDAYCDALVSSGWDGDLAVVRRSMLVSNLLRLGWAVDEFLSGVEQLPDREFARHAARLGVLASLR